MLICLYFGVKKHFYNCLAAHSLTACPIRNNVEKQRIRNKQFNKERHNESHWIVITIHILLKEGQQIYAKTHVHEWPGTCRKADLLGNYVIFMVIKLYTFLNLLQWLTSIKMYDFHFIFTLEPICVCFYYSFKHNMIFLLNVYAVLLHTIFNDCQT